MQGNFEACHAITARWEGGLSDDKADPGGLTWKGVSTPAGAEWRARQGLAPKPVNKWSDAEIRAFYVGGYWNAIKGDMLEAGVDLAGYDAAVNSGVGRARNWLADAVPKGDGMDRIKAICDRRLSFLHGLKTWSHFGKGWAKRVADIEAKGVAMWLKVAHPKSAKKVLQGEADNHADLASVQGKVSLGGVASGTAGSTLTAGHVDWWIIAAIVALALAVAIPLGIEAMRNREKSSAYSREAQRA